MPVVKPVKSLLQRGHELFESLRIHGLPPIDLDADGIVAEALA